ncbi:cuticle protein 16.5-like [Agrilus planipennis]|uniref:Cuticle protein 16.5-like n=1 Tax=Agrilus planipennis TaxID=224129 RepID=A0A1W4WQQ9_AGRPL|nr:cuticle protein 16.5-like [Agrilus planipennis]
MSIKVVITFALIAITSCYGSLVPAAAPLAYGIAPYASSYSASYVNHAIAAPYFAAPAAPYLAAPAAPYLAAPAAPYLAAPAAPLIARAAPYAYLGK